MDKKYFDEKFGYFEERFEKIDQRFEMIDKRFEKMDLRLEDMLSLFASQDRRLSRLETKFDGFHTEFTHFRQSTDQSLDDLGDRVEILTENSVHRQELSGVLV